MVAGLSVNNVVNVQVNLAPTAVPSRNFGALLIAGSSDVIDPVERIRLYTTIEGVTDDFGTSAPEYLAANLFFSQSPKPALLYIGRWAETATAAKLYGAPFNATERTSLLAALNLITDGSLIIPTDGSDRTVTGLNFSAVTTLSGAATVIDTAYTHGTVTYDTIRNRFVVTSGTTGASSTLGYAKPAGSGTDVSASLRLNSGVALTPVAGVIAETALAATQAFASKSNDWYGLMFADTSLTNDHHVAIAAYIESASQARIYGLTTQAAGVIDSATTTDIASLLSDANYMRTFVQYSTSSPYAAASLYGRAFTVDFTANNTTITLKFKQQPGVTAEVLTETQAATLKAKNCNVFVKYQNDTAIIQEGVMSNGYFFDEVHNADWFANALQVAVANRLYTATTKIPQTDAGIHVLTAEVERVCVAAVNNGMLAPGVWTAPLQVGPLRTGDVLPKGFFVYVPPVAQQLQADREARKAPTHQIAAKFAGAVHRADVIVNLNR